MRKKSLKSIEFAITLRINSKENITLFLYLESVLSLLLNLLIRI